MGQHVLFGILVSLLAGCGGDREPGAPPVDAGESADGGVDAPIDAPADVDGGSSPCSAGDSRSCYGGPSGTAGVGVCALGASTCGADGRWGPCEGEVVPGVEDCSTPADEDCDGAGPCPLPVLWSTDLGGGCASALAVGADGSIAVAGRFAGSRTILGTDLVSAGSSDVFFSRLDADGTPVWTRQIGGPEAESLAGVAFAGSDVVVAGSFARTVDAAGATLTSAGSDDAFSVRIAGSAVSAARYGDAGPDVFSDLIGDATGVVLAGRSSGIDLGSGVLAEGFVVKLALDGEIEWTSDGHPAVGALASHDGAVTMADAFSDPFEFGADTLTPSGSDIYVVRWTSAGAPAFGRVIETAFTYPVTLAAGPGGRYAVGTSYTAVDVTVPGGPARPETSSGSDAFFASFGPDATLDVAAYLYENGGGVGVHENIAAIAYDPEGRAYVAGSIDSAIDTPAGVLATATANNYSDAVLLVWGPDGTFLHGQLFGEARPEEASWAVVADATGVYTSVCTDRTEGILYKLSPP